LAHAHLDRGHRVERWPAQLPVVQQSHLDPVAEPGLGHPRQHVVAPLGGQGDAGGVHAVVLGGVQDERAPTAADVEQPPAGAQVELAADQVELVAGAERCSSAANAPPWW
jgi:hypothetical protein